MSEWWMMLHRVGKQLQARPVRQWAAVSTGVARSCLRLLVGLTLTGSTGFAGAAELSGFDCLMEPNAVTDIGTREEGVLEAILVDRGDLLVVGQVIATLESSVELAAVELAEARTELDAEIEEQRVTVGFAKRSVERSEELYRKKAISAFEKDEVDTTLIREKLKLRQILQRQRLAVLEYRRALKLLEKRTVHSPVRGIVMERLVNVGESVENRAILKVAQVDPLSVEVIIPVAHYGTVTRGDTAEVIPKYPGAGIQRATVDVVDRVIDAASDTFGVRLSLPNPDYEILGGVRCEVQFLPE